MKKLITIISALLLSSLAFAQGTWQSATVKAYMDNCVPEAEKSLGRADAIEYCNCTRLKLEIRYPDAADLNNLTEDEINELAKICLAEMSDDNSSSNSGSNTNNNNNTSPQPPRPPGPAGSSTVKVEQTGATNWSKTAYDAFNNSCVDSAKDALGEAEAKTYCACAAQKLQVLYPDENDLGDIPTDVINKVAEECIGN